MAAELPRARMPAPALRLLGDDRLFRIAANGDSRAFEAIYERHHQALYRYCRSIVGNGDDAADALQSTMASALRGLAGERREIALKPWLFRIAHNECVSLLRKRRAHAAIDDALELEAPAHDPALRQRLQELVADLRELPHAQRGALVMHELNGLRYRDIAAALDTTEPHARQLVYEARTGLHALAEGRAMECDVVERAISDSDGRVMRGRRIRAHLRACSRCSGFDQLIRGRRRDLAAIVPPLPAAAAAALLHNVLGGSSGGASATAAGSAGGSGLGSLAAGKVAAGSIVAKAAAVVAVTAAAGAGAVEVARHAGATPSSHRGSAPQAAPAAAPAAGSRRATLPAVPAAGSRAGRAQPTPKPAHTRGHSRRSHTHAPAKPKRSHPAHPPNGRGNGASHPPKPKLTVKPHPAHPVKQAPKLKPQSKPKAAPQPKQPPAATEPTPAKPPKLTPDAGGTQQQLQPKSVSKQQRTGGDGEG